MRTMIFQPTVDFVVGKMPSLAETLVADLKNLTDGHWPAGIRGSSVPELDKWLVVIVAGHLRLSGMVRHHPVRLNGLMVTSPLCAIDCQTFVWARTASRFYRLVSPVYGSMHREKA